MTDQIVPIDAEELDAEIAPAATPAKAKQPSAVLKDIEKVLLPKAVQAVSKAAIASFVLALLTFWTLGFTALPAIIFGHVGLAATRGGGRGRWMAVVGLALGYATIALFAFVIFGGLLYAILN